MHPRIRRESRTVNKMIAMYCRHYHRVGELCPDCTGLLAYTCDRLVKCPFGADKTTCDQCSVHCYRPEMREKIRAVMQYAGPRMIFHHPIAAVHHLIDRRRKGPLNSSF